MYNHAYDKLVGLSTLTAKINNDRLKGMGEFCLFSSMAFFVPFLLSSQILAGFMVNISLIGGSLYLKGRNLIPVIILPSIGVLARGMIFGPITFYLIYMLPFIWLGNASLIFSMKLFHLKMRKSYFVSALTGSFLKFSLLFLAAFALYSLKVIPVEFLAIMGIMQLLTAVSAGVAFFPMRKIRERK